MSVKTLFTVYHSNQVDVLKSLLVELIRLDPLNSPFDKEQILVQSPGMSQWLKMALAEEFGVMANIEFSLPASFIWEKFTQVLQDIPARSAFNKEAMAWKLMDILPSQLSLNEFAPLKQYLADDDDRSKLYQLAFKIADIFDSYLVYRPEWIATWEAGKEVIEIGDEHPWQPILWRTLYDHTLALGQSPYHRANLYEHFIDVLSNHKGEIEALSRTKRLFVFGITALPPRYMDALKAIGEHMDVHLMFTNPCRYYWGEVRDRKFLARLAAKTRQHLVWQGDHSEQEGCSPQLKGSLEDNLDDTLHTHVVGNTLLASMGKLGRDNMYLLSQLESHEIEAFVDIDRDCLLHQLQADILNLEEHQDDLLFASSEHKRSIEEDDISLSINLCHSPMREVEVLHDQLLNMFDKNPNLKPRDIVVMVSDIQAYSPAIQAVFGNAPGERYIPFSISDRSADQESPILKAFLQLLNLPNTRCLASELLELLETPAILAKFELNEADFNRAKLWVEETGIRWGLDAETGQEFDLPALEQNTWQFGIQRMLLGYAMPTEIGLFKVEGTALSPYREVEGIGAELAGKLAHYIETVSKYRQSLCADYEIEVWREILLQLLEDFFCVELEGEGALKSIRDALLDLRQQISDASYTHPLSLSIIAQHLQDKLSGTRISQRFLAGQVNFCTLMPMRSIPFDVVCLLGMNDGIYPRSIPPEGFDLMNNRARHGDRSRRDDDRYLFLEAILSAQKTLYISYVGHSIQDNTERIPSVLLSELLEYCGQNYRFSCDGALSCDESGKKLLDAITHHHPMVPYSAEAFLGSMPSFAREWLPAIYRQGIARESFDDELTDYLLDATALLNLELAELQRFWRLPVEYFFNRRLKVAFEPPLPVMQDDEPFTLNGLQSYQMRGELLDKMIKQSGQESEWLSDFLDQQRAQGKLPIGAFGDIEFEVNRVQVEALADKIGFLCNSPCEDLEVKLNFEAIGEIGKQVQLVGWLTQHYQSGLVRFRSGKIRAQDYLSVWIDHLAMSAMGVSKPTHMLGYDRKEGLIHIKYDEINDSVYATRHLHELISLLYEGMNKPLCYFPRTALAAIEASLKRGEWVEDKERATKEMAKSFNDSYLTSGEGKNAYIRRIWPDWNDQLAHNAYQLALKVLEQPRRVAKLVDDELK